MSKNHSLHFRLTPTLNNKVVLTDECIWKVLPLIHNTCFYTIRGKLIQKKIYPAIKAVMFIEYYDSHFSLIPGPYMECFIYPQEKIYFKFLKAGDSFQHILATLVAPKEAHFIKIGFTVKKSFIGSPFPSLTPNIRKIIGRVEWAEKKTSFSKRHLLRQLYFQPSSLSSLQIRPEISNVLTLVPSGEPVLYSHYWPFPTENGQIRIMSILDEFSRECFTPYASLIEPRPDNCLALLERDKPEALLVESAWQGNRGTWQYRVAQYAHPPGQELKILVNACKERGIPTLFWNKEDPVHFEKFIASAQLFDHIFTTGEETIPKYKKNSKARIYALPFAAESTIHNPINSPAKRNGKVCFAGSFYANRFPERRQDQIMLLETASHFDLDIYDRNADNLNDDFHFPERFTCFVRGKLPYRQLVEAYRQYSVFLNVNSVIDSQTMLSRRVFELLACGTPVVSTISAGIKDIFGENIVWMVRNKDEAHEALKTLLNDPSEWRRRSLQGIRLVFSAHTMTHRIHEILRLTGLRQNSLPSHQVLLIAQVRTLQEVAWVKEMVSRQKLAYGQISLCLWSNNLNMEPPVLSVTNKQEILFFIHEQATTFQASHILFLTPHAVYGAFFIQDLLNALEYSGTDAAGKPPSGQDTWAFGIEASPGSLLWKIESFQNLPEHEQVKLLDTTVPIKANQNKFFLADAANYFYDKTILSDEDRFRKSKLIEL